MEDASVKQRVDRCPCIAGNSIISNLFKPFKMTQTFAPSFRENRGRAVILMTHLVYACHCSSIGGLVVLFVCNCGDAACFVAHLTCQDSAKLPQIVDNRNRAVGVERLPAAESRWQNAAGECPTALPRVRTWWSSVTRDDS